MFDKLSEELKASRIRAGITLQQLAGKTRIDIKFLEYFEDGNFSFLPEPCPRPDPISPRPRKPKPPSTMPWNGGIWMP